MFPEAPDRKLERSLPEKGPSLRKREIRAHFSFNSSTERILFHAAASCEHMAD